ncbi:MAG: replication initiation protein, partial [Peptostreptococcaceae bacterium]|nr:replication initiation protein [Peptostreptococcaceae bacterium]
MTKIKPFTNDRFAKVSREILDKNFRTNLGLHAQKLLYGLASCLDESETMFPAFDIHIDGLFKYLNIENTNERYKIVREAIGEIAKNPLEYRVNEKKWGFLAWFSMAKFDAENSNYVTIRFGNDVKPYLLGLKEYCRLDARYYIDLSGNYSMWLYPLLRNVANKREPFMELSLKEIRELTYNEKTPAYNPEKSKDANRDLLRCVLGIEKKRGAKYYSPIKTVTKDGEIKQSGAIAEINDKTDLYVECDVIKQGRSISLVRFNVQFKTDTFQGKRKAIRKAYRTDF